METDQGLTVSKLHLTYVRLLTALGSNSNLLWLWQWSHWDLNPEYSILQVRLNLIGVSSLWELEASVEAGAALAHHILL